MIVTGFVIAASVAGALGQGMAGLSANCQAAAASVLTGPAAECLGLPQFMNVVTTPANQSLVMPINNWLTSTCAQPACTNDTLEAAVSNITNGCANDLHITSIEAQEITQSIKEWYSVGREVACLQDTSNGNVYCATTFLQKLETWFGAPLTLANLPALSHKLDANNGPPKEVVCTDCTRTAYTIVRPHLTSSQQSAVDEYLNGLCGSGFTNGSAPAAIKQTANNGGPESSGAVALSSGMSPTGTLLAVVGGLALLVAST